MKENKEIFDFIKNLPSFADSKPETVNSIVKYIQEKKLFKNETLYLQGDRVESIYIIKEGKLEICKMSYEGKKITIKMLEKGELFCLGNIFSDIAIHTCMANRDSILYSIPSKTFKKLCEQDKNLSSFIIDSLVKNIAGYSALIERINLMDGEACISSLLLAIQKNKTVRATQEELADMSGLCRETVSRLLKNLKNMGCVETHKGSVVIKNLEQLKQLCG